MKTTAFSEDIPLTKSCSGNLEFLKHIVRTVHDCKRAQCHLKEGTVQKKVEQEIKFVKSIYIKHNFNTNVYILNRFRLTHSFDKF